ncbi:hypothetical protein [Actinocorallia libanotica]|uniref:Carboxypeptidase family protein n=1 Tax=Actinocorallia libanotica TaxID=46162 RepID=A0ABN1QJS5_9ACTN
MFKEVLGATTLGSALLAAPVAAASDQTSGSAASVPGRQPEPIQVDVDVKAKTGAKSVATVVVADADGTPLSGRFACIPRTDEPGVSPQCKNTNSKGTAVFNVDSDGTYRVTVKATQSYEGFKGETFKANKGAANPKPEGDTKDEPELEPIRVETGVTAIPGSKSIVRTVVTTEEGDFLSGRRVCVPRVDDPGPTPQCKKTDDFGSVVFNVDGGGEYRITVDATKKYGGFKGKKFKVDTSASNVGYLK